MSDNIKKIQIQSVVYNNNKLSLIKALKAIKQSVYVTRRLLGDMHIDIAYGDASPSPILSESDKKDIQEMLEEDIHFNYVFFNENTGTAKGHNTLLVDKELDYVLIMNPDVIMEPRCIYYLVRGIIDSKIGMVEARQTPLEHAKEYDVDSGETDWSSTACALFKKDIFDEIGGFDADTFFMYCDDLDFSWRLRLAGYKIIYNPRAIVYHSKYLTNDAKWKPTNAEVYYSAEAALLLAYKWSFDERVDYLRNMFMNSPNNDEKKAYEEFEKRKKECLLPERLDENHRIAKFYGDDYCNMRFIIGE